LVRRGDLGESVGGDERHAAPGAALREHRVDGREIARGGDPARGRQHRAVCLGPVEVVCELWRVAVLRGIGRFSVSSGASSAAADSVACGPTTPVARAAFSTISWLAPRHARLERVALGHPT
jgi:hypothetical protein